MQLVMNASPVIFLVKLNLIHHVTTLFEEIIIPDGVKSEITKHKDDAQKWISGKGVNYLKNVGEIPSNIRAWDLGKGESEVIAFAHKNENSIVALDDKAARNCAFSLNIRVIGTIGLLLLMKKKNLIDDVGTHLKKLRNYGFRINDDLFEFAVELSNK